MKRLKNYKDTVNVIKVLQMMKHQLICYEFNGGLCSLLFMIGYMDYKLIKACDHVNALFEVHLPKPISTYSWEPGLTTPRIKFLDTLIEIVEDNDDYNIVKNCKLALKNIHRIGRGRNQVNGLCALFSNILQSRYESLRMRELINKQYPDSGWKYVWTKGRKLPRIIWLLKQIYLK